MGRRAVFLDKDGTLVENVPYNVDPARIVLTANAGPGLRLLQRQGFRLIVVSNQPGVALGRFPESALARVRARLEELAAACGVRLEGFHYCPHAPGPGGLAPCSCRKPAPGLLLQAARVHGVDLPGSWLIGDILDDIEAGRRAGCKTILIDNGNETEWHVTPQRCPHGFALDLLHAATLVAVEEARATETRT